MLVAHSHISWIAILSRRLTLSAPNRASLSPLPSIPPHSVHGPPLTLCHASHPPPWVISSAGPAADYAPGEGGYQQAHEGQEEWQQAQDEEYEEDGRGQAHGSYAAVGFTYGPPQGEMRSFSRIDLRPSLVDEPNHAAPCHLIHMFLRNPVVSTSTNRLPTGHFILLDFLELLHGCR